MRGRVIVKGKTPPVPTNNGKKTVIRNEKGQIMTGSGPLNPMGMRKGTRHFHTDFDEVVDDIARQNGISQSEARKVLIRKAYIEAKAGSFPFYKDILDRYYGKAVELVDVTTGGEKIGTGLSDEEKKQLRRIFGKNADGRSATKAGDGNAR